MGRNIEDVIAGLPKERRTRIRQKARQMADEMIAYADSLGAVRRAASKTQSQMGVRLGMPQSAISQLEKRSDVLVSTLARYVDALGGELDLIVRMGDGTEIVLQTLGRSRSSKRRNAHETASTPRTRGASRTQRAANKARERGRR